MILWTQRSTWFHEISIGAAKRIGRKPDHSKALDLSIVDHQSGVFLTQGALTYA